MTPFGPLGRALATGTAVLTALAAGVVVAASARATVADVDSGGALTRSMVVERAYSWTTEKVPYSETSYYPAAAPRTGVGHSYRQDCSGFVSMAWDLPTSAVTGDFVSATSAYDTRLSSWNQLLPGDLLGISTHTVIFLGWSADDAGRHRYFDLASESTSARPAAVSLDQDNQGYWQSYAPYRDTNIVDDLPAAVSWGGGRTDSVSLTASGHVIHQWRAAPGGVVGTEDLTAAHGFPILRTAPSIASQGPGLLDIVGTGTGGALIDLSYGVHGWSSATLTGSGAVYGISAAGGAGRLDLVGRQPGNDDPGTLMHATLIGGAFSGWTAIGGPSVVGDPAAVRASNAELDAVVEQADGTLAYGRSTAAGWTWTSPFGTTTVALRPALARLANGILVATIHVGTTLEQSTRSAGGSSWSSFTPVSGAAAVTAPLTAPVRTSTLPGGLAFYAGHPRPVR